MRLNNRKSYMTSLPEGQAPKSAKPRFTQILYLAVLLAVILYIANIFLEKYFFLNGVGYVTVEKLSISAARSGRINWLDATKGQKLEPGSQIAEIDNRINCMIKDDPRIEKLRYEIDDSQAVLDSMRLQNKRAQSNINPVTPEQDNNLYRALELGLSLQKKIPVAEQPVLIPDSEIDLLSRQIQLKKRRLQNLRQTTLSVEMSSECFNEIVKAPVAATVFSVKKKPYEVVKSAETIVTLVADDAVVKIDVDVANDEFLSVNIGDILDLELPGKQKSQGIVNSIVSSAFDSEERLTQQYKPVATDLRIFLKPSNQDHAMLWKQYDQMEVKVRGHK
jgi:multidrug resistance efflux pump